MASLGPMTTTSLSFTARIQIERYEELLIVGEMRCMGILLVVSVTQYVRGEAYCLVRAQAVTGTVTGCHRLSQGLSQAVTGCHRDCHRLSQAVTGTVSGCHRLSQGLSQAVTGCHRDCHRLSQAVTGTVTGCHSQSQGLSHHVHASVYVSCCVSPFTSGDASIPANR